MDKQREEFEKWYFNENYKGTTACELKVFEVLSGLVGVESPYNGTYPNHNVQVSWKAWQQAQKVAVPDGCVVVPREPTKTMLIAADNCEIDGKVTAHNIYKAMIEAQEN